jgi:hypothetical protein
MRHFIFLFHAFSHFDDDGHRRLFISHSLLCKLVFDIKNEVIIDQNNSQQIEETFRDEETSPFKLCARNEISFDHGPTCRSAS